jgi:hypothetical protein
MVMAMSKNKRSNRQQRTWTNQLNESYLIDNQPSDKNKKLPKYTTLLHLAREYNESVKRLQNNVSSTPSIIESPEQINNTPEDEGKVTEKVENIAKQNPEPSSQIVHSDYGPRYSYKEGGVLFLGFTTKTFIEDRNIINIADAFTDKKSLSKVFKCISNRIDEFEKLELMYQDIFSGYKNKLLKEKMNIEIYLKKYYYTSLYKTVIHVNDFSNNTAKENLEKYTCIRPTDAEKRGFGISFLKMLNLYFDSIKQEKNLERNNSLHHKVGRYIDKTKKRIDVDKIKNKILKKASDLCNDKVKKYKRSKPDTVMIDKYTDLLNLLDNLLPLEKELVKNSADRANMDELDKREYITSMLLNIEKKLKDYSEADYWEIENFELLKNQISQIIEVPKNKSETVLLLGKSISYFVDGTLNKINTDELERYCSLVGEIIRSLNITSPELFDSNNQTQEEITRLEKAQRKETDKLRKLLKKFIDDNRGSSDK